MAKSNGSHRAQQNESSYANEANDMVASMTRQQLVLTENWMAQIFRVSESFQRTQQQFSERAAMLHGQAAENLGRATNATELGYIQSNLLMSWMQEAVRFYLDMTMMGAKLGTETLHPDNNSAAATTAETVNGAARNAMGAAAPMMQAWQMLFTPPLGGLRH